MLVATVHCVVDKSLSVKGDHRTLQRADLTGEIGLLRFLTDIYVPGSLLIGQFKSGQGSWSPGCGTVSKHEEIGAFRMFIWIYVQERKAKILEGSRLVSMLPC